MKSWPERIRAWFSAACFLSFVVALGIIMPSECIRPDGCHPLSWLFGWVLFFSPVLAFAFLHASWMTLRAWRRRGR
jgi:hypothetical protein